MSAPPTASAPDHRRFGPSDRVQHAVMALAFLILALTGLPQRYANAGIRVADQTIHMLGGIEAIRVVHRAAATVLMAVTIYHILDVAYRVLVRRTRLTMLPRYQDLLDAVQSLRHNLFGAGRPRMDRFTWEEKVEYWSLVWGTVVMILTGFMLWNPIATARFLPGEAIPASQVVHGAEAVLAILAVIVWHMYAVHLRHFNRSMFTGRMSQDEMREEHPLELERVLSGADPETPDPALLRRRQRVFFPVAAVVATVLLAGLYWFVTFEQTAITTLPPR